MKVSPATVIATGALVLAAGGGVATAATGALSNGSVTTKSIKDGAVTSQKIHHGAVTQGKLSSGLEAKLKGKAGPAGPQGAKGDTGAAGATGPQGPAGTAGAPGANGTNGTNGLNPATPVLEVPSIASSSSSNPNPDSGNPGDGGWYFTGDANGAAALDQGELVLTGNGIDSNTEQGADGIAKAYNNIPLANLDELSYQWHVNVVDGDQAPSIHVTVTGLTSNSHFKSGFANLDFAPGLNGGPTPTQGVVYQSDTMEGGKWFSTTNPSISAPGGQNDPESFAAFVAANPNAVISQISVDNGGTSGGTGTFNAGVDDVLIGTAGDGSFTRYDFDG